MRPHGLSAAPCWHAQWPRVQAQALLRPLFLYGSGTAVCCLPQAERTLDRMERRLLALDRDYRAAKQSASGALQGRAGGGRGGEGKEGDHGRAA